MTVTKRLNLADAVRDLAPPPPPCFHNRFAWMEFLTSAAEFQNNGRGPRPSRKVILLVDEQPQFNRTFNFCADCNQQHSLQMMREGKCQPDYLKKDAK